MASWPCSIKGVKSFWHWRADVTTKPRTKSSPPRSMMGMAGFSFMVRCMFNERLANLLVRHLCGHLKQIQARSVGQCDLSDIMALALTYIVAGA
jgi:hypothetical protein